VFRGNRDRRRTFDALLAPRYLAAALASHRQLIDSRCAVHDPEACCGLLPQGLQLPALAAGGFHAHSSTLSVACDRKDHDMACDVPCCDEQPVQHLVPILAKSRSLMRALPPCRRAAYLGRAVVVPQALRRGAVQRRAFLVARAAVIRLQAAARGSIVRRRLAAMRAGAIAIQAHFRGYHIRRALRRQQVQLSKPAERMSTHQDQSMCMRITYWSALRRTRNEHNHQPQWCAQQ
jgi:hypothetical protein